MNIVDLVRLGIWVVIIGGVFAYLWRKGHLMKLSTYVVETREELKKCTWPSRDELKGSTVVVLITIALLSLLIIVVGFRHPEAGPRDAALAVPADRSMPSILHEKPVVCPPHAFRPGTARSRRASRSGSKPRRWGSTSRKCSCPWRRWRRCAAGKKTVSTRKLYPGYVFIDMALLDENQRIIEKPVVFHPGHAGDHRFCRRRPADADVAGGDGFHQGADFGIRGHGAAEGQLRGRRNRQDQRRSVPEFQRGDRGNRSRRAAS